MTQMKGITCCGDCGYYNWKKHKCTRATDEGNARDKFYADCPLPDVVAVPVVRCKDCICYDDEPGGTLKMCYCGLGWTSPDDYCSKGARAKKMDGESDG